MTSRGLASAGPFLSRGEASAPSVPPGSRERAYRYGARVHSRHLARVAALVTATLVGGCDSGGNDEGGGSAKAEAPPAGQLAADWWTWAARRPKGQDPVTDRSGRRCAQDQPDDVFFLAGTTGGPARRTCEVPAGRPLFFPVINFVCTVRGAAAGAAAKCGHGLRAAKTSVRVDGRAVKPQYVESQVFSLDPDPKSPFADVGGRVVAVGHHVRLEPLEPGSHSISFSGDDREGLKLRVAYRLTVR